MLSGEGVVICENSCLSSALALKATNKILSQVNPKVVAKNSSKQSICIQVLQGSLPRAEKFSANGSNLFSLGLKYHNCR